MTNLVVIGAGEHSRHNHLPALQRYVLKHPGELVLSALCDLRKDHVASISRQFGFKRSYVDIDEMLARESPDGCVAVTPIPITGEVAARLISRRIPLLMEKPPGATLKEAQAINALVKESGVPVMVSMNRRFAPVIAFISTFAAGRRIEWVRATMLRNRRSEPEFFYGTGIHALDAMRHLAGDIGRYTTRSRQVDGTRWFTVEINFINGTRGELEVMPTCGRVLEKYELLGTDFCVEARLMGDRSGTVTSWENGNVETTNLALDKESPFVDNGTYGETVEFIDSIRENRTPYPSPEMVFQSVEVCEHILNDAENDRQRDCDNDE
jgi:myo-inositol 2-dehydrogenase/D-chiro-inositol 1-dehydrogenase